MKPFLQNDDIEIYSTHNEGKSLTPKRFTRTIKSKFINAWKCVYWLKWKLKRNTIKTKLVDVKSNTYFDSSKGNKKKGPEFKVDNNVRLSK